MSAGWGRVYHIYMKSKMRLLKYILLLAVAPFLSAGCSGNVDESALPLLEVSERKIDLAQKGTAEFTVKFNGQDVTAESDIVPADPEVSVDGNVFMPQKEGKYVFHAVYDGKKSNEVAVEVENSGVKVESKYERHVSIIEFTGAWCSICPGGYKKMMSKLQRLDMAEYADFIHICAFHSKPESDALAIPETDDAFGLFSGLAYPSYMLDMRVADLLDDDGVSRLIPNIMESFNDHPAHCGVAVSSVMNAGKTEAEVTVRVASEITSAYRVLILVVEDNILAPDTPQLDPPFHPDGNKDYVHKHVVRDVVTSYMSTFTGEKITSDGNIAAGEEADMTWKVPVDVTWKLEDTEIYALVLDSFGHVNNMNLCAIDGGNSDYRLRK